MMVPKLQLLMRRPPIHWLSLKTVVGCLVMSSVVAAQQVRHPLYSTAIQPPGAIGQQQLQRGGPIRGYYQPVLVRVPDGSTVSLASEGGFDQLQVNELLAGMLIGPLYRLRVSDIPLMEGVRLYPTIEVINRLHPPAGYAPYFPIVVEITLDDLRNAAAGTLVTRVIYLEDPNTPVPYTQPFESDQPYFDVLGHEDPLHVAAELGRPMAIVRIGSRTLESDDGQSQDLGVPIAPFIPLDVSGLQARKAYDQAISNPPAAVPSTLRTPNSAPTGPTNPPAPEAAAVPVEARTNANSHDMALPADLEHPHLARQIPISGRIRIGQPKRDGQADGHRRVLR